MKNITAFLLLLLPSLAVAGVHVQQNDPSLVIGSVTVSGTSVFTSSGSNNSAVTINEGGQNLVNGLNMNITAFGGADTKGILISNFSSSGARNYGIYSNGVPSAGDAVGGFFNANSGANSYGVQTQAIGAGINNAMQCSASGGTANHAINILAGDVAFNSTVCAVGQVFASGGAGAIPYCITPSTLSVTSIPPNVPLYVNTSAQLAARAIRLNTADVTDVLAQTNGGTGQSAYTNGQLLIGDSSTGGLDLATLTAGTNVTISSGNGSITINSTGGGGGAATLPLPPGDTNYIQNTSTLQTGTASFFVSNGHLDQSLFFKGIGSSSAQLYVGAFNDFNITNSTGNIDLFPISTVNITGTEIVSFGIAASTLSISSTSAFSGNVAISSGVLLSGSAGSNGQVLTSGGPNTTPSWSTLTGASLASTQTFTGSNTFASTVALRGGLYYSNPNTITASYTAVSTDTLILGNVISISTIIVTLPASNATSKGQVLTISKVDTTTGPVIIQSNGTDVIAGTGTLSLNAFTQTDSIIADGNGHWLPWGQGLQITPPSLSFGGGTGVGFVGGSQVSIAVSSDTDVCAIYVPVPVAVTGFRTNVVATGNGVYAFGIYDAALNLVASTGPVTIAGTGLQQTTMAVPVNLPPGQYLFGVTINNTTTSLGGIGAGATMPFCSRKAGSTSNLVNPYVLGTGSLKAFTINATLAGGRTIE